MDDENAGLAHAEQGTTRLGEGKASARKRGIAARGAGGAAYFASLLAIALIAATPVQARVTRIVIGTTESPTFGGTSFGAVGKY